MRRRGKEKLKRAAALSAADFFVVPHVRRRQRMDEVIEAASEESASDRSEPLARLAAAVALETQCRVYKDDRILCAVISRELGWNVASVPPVPSTSLSAHVERAFAGK